jgi:hypothetical protein
VISAECDRASLTKTRALVAWLGASTVVAHGSRHGTRFNASQATNSSLLALSPICPDTPMGAQLEVLSIRSRALELPGNAADTCGREARENGYLQVAPVDADESLT